MLTHLANSSVSNRYMITVDSLSEAANSGNVIFHEFLHFYRPDRQIVYGIVEGRDDPAFYRGAIDPLLPEGWLVKLIPAGTKNKVLSAFQIKEWERYPKGCVCFFVDRDLSDLIPEPCPIGDNLYITDNYSIECEVVNYRVAQRTLEEIMGVTNLTIEESEILSEVFDRNLATFRESLLPLMAQIVHWRRSGLRPCLSNFDPSIFFEYHDGIASLKPEFASVDARLAAASAALESPVSADPDLKDVQDQFCAVDGVHRFTRGKYLLKFLLDFLSAAHSAISMYCAKHSKPPGIRVSLGPKNAMAEMALRARCPASLKQFIERNYGEFIKQHMADA